MRAAIRSIVFVVCAIAVTTLSAEPCDIGVAGLEKLLDQALPLRAMPVWKTGARKILTVRYTPADSSSSGERLISFIERDNGSVATTVRRMRRPLMIQVDEITSREPDMTCATIVQRLVIDEVLIEGQPLVRLEQLYRKLLKTEIKVDVSGDAHLDTAKYDLFVSGGMEDLGLTLFPASAKERRAHPVIRILEELIRNTDESQREASASPPAN